MYSGTQLILTGHGPITITERGLPTSKLGYLSGECKLQMECLYYGTLYVIIEREEPK